MNIISSQVLKGVGITAALFSLFFGLLIGGPMFVSIAGLIVHLIIGY